MESTAAQGPIYSQFASDPDFEELLQLFVDSMPERREELQQYMLQQDVNGIRSTAHQLKGAAGGYGFDLVTDVAARLEQACRDHDIDRVGESLEQLIDYLERVAV